MHGSLNYHAIMPNLVGIHPLGRAFAEDRSENPVYRDMIEEMIEDFDRTVGVEALHLANETSELSFYQAVDR